MSISTSYRSGLLKKTIYIVTNDPSKKEVSIVVKADIREILSLDPTFLNLGNVAEASTGTYTVFVRNKGGSPITVTDISIRPGGSWLGLEPAEGFRLEPGESRKLTVSVKPGPQHKNLNGYIQFKTDNPDLPPKTVRIFGHVLRTR